MKKIILLLLCALPLAQAVRAQTTVPPEDYDTQFTIYVNGSESWTPFPGKSGVVFSNSDNNALSIRDNGKTVEYTGKQVGESVITAMLGGSELKALVRIRAAEAGKKYITYNKPFKSYYIEYDGGTVSGNKNGDAGNAGYVIEAYDHKKFAYVAWSDPDNAFIAITRTPGGKVYSSESYGSNVWYGLEDTDEWADGGVIEVEYPLDRFAAYVSKRKGAAGFVKRGMQLWQIADAPGVYEMPDHTDVTGFYVRSEKVMDIICDVYQDSSGSATLTFWVDPVTGLTLKCEVKGQSGQIDRSSSYEVTKLVIGNPDWDGKHLHPLAADEIKLP